MHLSNRNEKEKGNIVLLLCSENPAVQT